MSATGRERTASARSKSDAAFSFWASHIELPPRRHSFTVKELREGAMRQPGQLWISGRQLSSSIGKKPSPTLVCLLATAWPLTSAVRHFPNINGAI